jgi:protein-L-isoaspartate O-methyltransferase
VDELVAGGYVRTERVERAFRRVPRHLSVTAVHDDGRPRRKVPHRPDATVADDVARRVYSDAELVTGLDDAGRPSMVAARPAHTAVILEALDLRGGERVLEIGAGTGYGTALLAAVTGAPVMSIEPNPAVARQARASLCRLGTQGVTVLTRNPNDGHADGGPFDRVIVNIGADGIAEAWLDQLDLDKFIVATIPVGSRDRVVGIERGRPWTARGWGIWWPTPAASPADHQDDVNPTSGQGTASGRFEPRLDEHALAALGAHLTLTTDGDWRVVEEAGALRLHRSGATVVVDSDGISVEGPAVSVDEIVTVIEDWQARGRPRFSDWSCELVLRGQPTGRFWWPVRWIGPEIAHRSGVLAPRLATGGPDRLDDQCQP